MYNLSEDKEIEAMRLIKKIYHPSENYESILFNLKLQCQKKSVTKVPYFEALFGEKYLRCTLIAMVITSLCQQSSVNVWTIFSNRIVTTVNETMPISSQFKANLGTQLVGYSSGISAMCAFIILQKYKRKSIFLAGQFLMALNLALFSLFISINWGYASMVVMCLFTISFQLTAGAVHWVYIPEILSDT